MKNNRTNINPLRNKQPYRTGEKSLTRKQVEILLEHITDLYHLGLIQLGIVTGIRREDIVKLKSRDVDFENSSVTYYETKKRRMRSVFIPQSVLNTLRMIIRINGKSVYVFPGNSKEGHLSGRHAYRILNKYLKHAGLPPRPFHALRATCYKLCQSKGWTPEQAAQHIGDTLRVAQEHYNVPSVEEMKEAATTKELI